VIGCGAAHALRKRQDDGARPWRVGHRNGRRLARLERRILCRGGNADLMAADGTAVTLAACSPPSGAN